jgi:hypothetical protein
MATLAKNLAELCYVVLCRIVSDEFGYSAEVTFKQSIEGVC